MSDDIITSLEIIEKLLFPETDFWRNNYLNARELKAERRFREQQYGSRERVLVSTGMPTRKKFPICVNPRWPSW